jgi:hypothetical protein
VKTSASRLELLRAGARISERFKLLERIPRWVADRRFLAQREGRSQREQLLFWEMDDQAWEAWLEGAEKFVAVDHSSLLRPRVMDDFQGFRYVAAREVRGPALAEKMDNEGALLAAEIRQIFPAAVSLYRTMAELGLPGPSLHWAAILLEKTSGGGLQPVFFPWATSGFSVVAPEEGPTRLRDFLLSISTHREISFADVESDWAALPSAARALFPASLRAEANWETLAEAIEVMAGPDFSLSARSANPPSGTEGRANSPNGRAPATERPPEVRPERVRRSKNSAGNKTNPKRIFVALGLALFVAGFAAGWFFHQWQTSIPAEAAGWVPADIREATPLASAELASPPTPPAVGNAFPPTPQTQASDGDDSADGNELQEAMLRWEQEWIAQPEEGRIIRGFTGYLEQMEFHSDALRAGQMPQALAALERLSEQGFAPARYLLGQVLWGRESLRAEAIMIELARNGHEGAQEWCDERAIDWRE